MEVRPHLIVNGFVTSEEFRSRRTGRNPIIPQQDRVAHGERLLSRYADLVKQFEGWRAQSETPITEDVGIYVEIISAPNCELRLDSLDTSRDFKLRLCRKEGEQEVGVIFIPESRRHVFREKLEQYLNPEMDSTGGPRNRNLVDCIAEIRLADLRSFWTDDIMLALIPRSSKSPLC